MPTPHRHANIIKAWADGIKVQYKNRETNEWNDVDTPSWVGEEYRIKPEPKILHGFIDPTTLNTTDISFTIFRPYQATSKDLPCTLTFFPDA